MRLRIAGVATLMVAWFGAPAPAAPLPETFTLGRYIPANVWLYVHGAHNPERAWIEEEWAEVWSALKASGIDQDVISIILSAVEDAKGASGHAGTAGDSGHTGDHDPSTASDGEGSELRSQIQRAIDKWSGLLKGVAWGDLAGREGVFAQRVAALPIPYEYFLLMRGNPGTAEKNMQGIVAILKEIASLSAKIQLTDRKVGEASVWTMRPAPPVTPELATVNVNVFRRGDVIGLTFGGHSLNEVLALMNGRGEGPGLSESPRFREALKQVKAPEDYILYFDMKGYLKSLKGMMTDVGKMAAQQGGPQGAPDATKAISIVGKILDIVDMTDYVVTSGETQGRRELTHTVTRLQTGRDNCPIAACAFGRKPFKRFDEFIPADAKGFNLTGFIDIAGVYKLITDFVVKEVPDGQSYIDQALGAMAAIGFDPQRDLFSWWSGEMVSVSLPPEVVTPMGGGDGLLMIRVKDGELASRKVNAFIDFVATMLQSHGQSLMITPVSIDGAEGFRQITHPMVAMFLRPVVGVRGDWLILGTSPSPVTRCLAVAKGDAPSIATNTRFREEGLAPKGPVLSASFTDTSNFGQELGAGITAMGFAGGMMSGMMQAQGMPEKAGQLLQKAMTTLAKLGPVVQKIDFYSSEASVTTYDGALTVRNEKVVTYKPRKNKTVKTAGTE